MSEVDLHAMSDEDLTLMARTATQIVQARRERLDAAVLDRVMKLAKPPAPGERGESLLNPTLSTFWPGLYIGRCRYCGSHFMGEKRAPSCDRCEENRIAARTTLNRETDQGERRGEG